LKGKKNHSQLQLIEGRSQKTEVSSQKNLRINLIDKCKNKTRQD
jgi:hypothetical protein